MQYTREIFDNLKETTEPIQYETGIDHKENTLYINDGILYAYDQGGKERKGKECHFILMNGVYLDNIPNKSQKRISNMKVNNSFCMNEEERKEFCKKGVEGRKQAQKERKTFRESLETFLNIETGASKAEKVAGKELYKMLPDSVKKHITEQDLIVLSAIRQAQNGSYNHATFIRDTVGEKPTDKQQITADIMTDADRALIEKLHNRIERADK